MSSTQQSDNQQFPNMAEIIEAATMQWAGTLCNSNIHKILDEHEDRIRVLQKSATDWLQRRREFGTESRKLLMHLRDCRDTREMMVAQHDWYGAHLRRLSADYASWIGLSRMMMGMPGGDVSAKPAATVPTPRGNATSRDTSLEQILAARATQADRQEAETH